MTTAIAARDDISPEVQDLIDRQEQMALAYEQLMRDAAASGHIDRARFREIHAAYGAIRRDILSHLGEDPESEGILPLPAELLHS